MERDLTEMARLFERVRHLAERFEEKHWHFVHTSSLRWARKRQKTESASDVSAGLVDALIEIGTERQRVLGAMKEALIRGDDGEALERARELTGLPPKNTVALNSTR
jgi:hypothetical protein